MDPLTDVPSGRPPAPLPGVGLALCGGGIAGAMYELGCLTALEDAFDGLSCTDFDLYVGTSGGASLAATLAGGVSVKRLYRAMLDPADDFFPLERKHVVRFDTQEWRRLVASASLALRRAALSVVSRPSQFDLWQELDRFYDSLPAGICNLEGYEEFLQAFFARRGIPNRFAEMPRRLFIPANDLDSGHRVVFGLGPHAHVPVSRAVCASSAIPIFYAPVRIGDRDYVDGGIGKVAHIDLAVRWGVDLVVAINPMVPVRNDPATLRIPTGHGRMPRVRDKGLMWVYNQAFRMSVRARIHQEQRRYRSEAPHVKVLLLEPHEDDATMFMYSPMNFAARRTLLRYGYDSTMAYLRREGAALQDVLAAHGITLRL